MVEYTSRKLRKIDRYPFVDFLRGVSVTFFTVFHLIWDLENFGLLKLQVEDGVVLGVPRHASIKFLRFVILAVLACFTIAKRFPGLASIVALWATFFSILNWKLTSQEYGVALIMFVMGMSSSLRHASGRSGVSRIAQIAIIAGFITLATWVAVPSKLIYFGALHCLAVNSILVLPFLRFGKFCGLISFIILAYTPLLGRFPLEVSVYDTLDITPWFHNLGWALLGVYSHYLGLYRFRSNVLESLVFSRLGKHSLVIYLIHQIALFPLVWVFKLILGYFVFVLNARYNFWETLQIIETKYRGLETVRFVAV